MDRALTTAAYVDGELTPDQARALEAEAVADPALARDIERQASLRALIADAYAPVLEEPVPSALIATATAANDHHPAKPWLWATGMAASLVLGLFAGRTLIPANPDPMIASQHVARALESNLAADQGPIRIGLTFRDGEGAWCRTFQDIPQNRVGLACREANQWRLQVLTAAAPQPTSDYRTAGAQTPPVVLAAVDALIAGEAVDQAGEAAARDAGWAAR